MRSDNSTIKSEDLGYSFVILDAYSFCDEYFGGVAGVCDDLAEDILASLEAEMQLSSNPTIIHIIDDTNDVVYLHMTSEVNYQDIIDELSDICYILAEGDLFLYAKTPAQINHYIRQVAAQVMDKLEKMGI